MAVRFTADGQDYTRTVSLTTQTTWSVSCWNKITTDRNAFTTVWNLYTDVNNYAYLQTVVNGTTMGYFDHWASTHRGARAQTVGTWYWWGVSINGAAGTVMSRALSDATTTTTTWASGGAASINQTTLFLGESGFATEWLNGSIAAFKWWGATLTAAELENESRQTMPYRTTGLRAWYPLDKISTVDYSGVGATLSGGTGATTEDGPGIPWSNDPVTLITPASAAPAPTSFPPLPAVRRYAHLLGR